MIFKSYLIEKDLTEIQKFKAVLLYGENDGLKDNLKQNLKIMRNQTEIINFFQDEIIKNKDLLLNEVNNSSLFSSNRTFFIHEATDKIFEKIQEIVENRNAEDKIIILSAIDNLIKGGAGQAVQNMNLKFGYKISEGLL